MKIRLIGDIHNTWEKLREILDGNYDLAIQLGDLGGAHIYDKIIESQPPKFKFFCGNHEDYGFLKVSPELQKYYLGRWGNDRHTINGGMAHPLFWVDGAFSINQKYLTPGLNWWPDEEIHYSEYPSIITAYLMCQPTIMLSHEGPRSIANYVGSPTILRNYGWNPETFTTNTSEFLQDLYEAWQPRLWFFGHYHNDTIIPKNNTTFHCIDEFSFVDLVV